MAENGALGTYAQDEHRHDDQTHHLEALRERLRAEGWYARVVAIGGRVVSLRVVNPSAPALNDDITVVADEAGLWWFGWSFGVRIAPAGDLDIAVTRIVQVLGRR